LSQLVDAVVKLVREAGQEVRRTRTFWVAEKEAEEPVTQVDMAVHELLSQGLPRLLPGSQVWSEEGERPEGELIWIVDPIDGTTNLVHGYPVVAISVALQEAGETHVGVVCDVFRDEVFSADVEEGVARRDGERLHVSAVGEFARALVGFGLPYRRTGKPAMFRAAERVARQVADLRRSGSAALDLVGVAAGQLDAFFEAGLRPWDVAAAALLVRLAGGRVSDWRGRPLDLLRTPLTIAASNGLTHDALLTLLAAEEGGDG
jgi:myo-inositol-1(or 4)-monophosphatase